MVAVQSGPAYPIISSFPQRWRKTRNQFKFVFWGSDWLVLLFIYRSFLHFQSCSRCTQCSNGTSNHPGRSMRDSVCLSRYTAHWTRFLQTKKSNSLSLEPPTKRITRLLKQHSKQANTVCAVRHETCIFHLLTGEFILDVVLVDKPVTATFEQADELGALAESKGLVLYAFQNRRFDSDFLALRRLIDLPTSSPQSLGSLVEFESQLVEISSYFPSYAQAPLQLRSIPHLTEGHMER